MKLLPFSSAGLAVSLLLALPLSGADGPPAPAPARTSRLARRIDELFHARLRPVPLPIVLPNPFIVVSGPGGPAGEPGPVASPANPAHPPADLGPLTDAEALQLFATRLKIGGTIEASGVIQLVINEVTCKEGDVVALEDKRGTVYLRILRLTAGELTLGYNEAALVINLKPPAKLRAPDS